MLVGFLGLMDFPVDGEYGTSSLAEESYMSLMESFKRFFIVFLIFLFKELFRGMIQLTLGGEVVVFFRSQFTFLRFHEGLVVGVSATLRVQVLRNLKVIIRLCS